jgi:hypothetical protein
MNKIDEAFNRIKILECPTGDLENRVTGILEDYGIANRSNVNIDSDTSLNRDDAQAYRVKISSEGQSFVVLAKSGSDDYVVNVIDVYSIS